MAAVSEPRPTPTTTGDAGRNIGPWSSPWEPDTELREAFEDLMAALRRFQDLSAGARPSVEVTRRVAAQVSAAADELEPFQVGEAQQLARKRSELPGRSQALLPVVLYDYAEDDRSGGRVTFGRYYVGGGAAAHGGSLPLVFDEFLGRLAGAGGRPLSRTAYLHVDYRVVTPIDVELTIDAAVNRVEGRKIFATGNLRHGDVVLAQAEALFVTLLPGQP